MKLRKLLTAGVMAVSALAAVTTAKAAILADMVWVIDISGSMGDDIAQVKQRILEFNTVMTNNSVDAQYALVVFGGNPVLRQNLTDFATFTAAGSPFSLTTANGGGTEDGSLALQLGLSSVSFRQDSVRNFVLVTDEDDDNATNRPALAAALAATVENELINIIGNPNDDSNNYYRDLAPANGGAFFNINDFRSNPAPFFTNFINTKLTEIVGDFCSRFPNDPSCQNRVPEPGSAALVGLALLGLAGVGRRKLSRKA